MTPQELLAPAIPSLWWVFLAAGAGALAAAVVGILWMQGRRVPGALGALPVALPAFVAVGLAAANPGIVAVGARIVLPLVTALPLTLLALFGAIAAIAKPPRVAWRAGLALVPVFGAAAVVWAGGSALDDAFFAGFRAVVYALAGLCCVPAMAAPDHDDRPGGEVAAAVGAGWALFVASGETGARALAELVALKIVAEAAPEHRLAILERGAADVLAPGGPWFYGAVAVALGLCAVGATAAGRAPVRLASAASAGLVALGALAFWTVGAPSPSALLATLP